MVARLVALAIVVTASALPGCSDDPATAGRSGDDQPPFKLNVRITESGYHPAEATVLVGGSVTWVNRDPTGVHTAQSATPEAEQSLIEPTEFDTHTLTWGEPYTVTFHKPGTYEYVCSFDSMKGVIHVVSRQPPQPSTQGS